MIYFKEKYKKAIIIQLFFFNLELFVDNIIKTQLVLYASKKHVYVNDCTRNILFK